MRNYDLHRRQILRDKIYNILRFRLFLRFYLPPSENWLEFNL